MPDDSARWRLEAAKPFGARHIAPDCRGQDFYHVDASFRDLLALYNDHSGRFPFPPKKRNPFVAAISHDGGRTWPHRRLIESDPDGLYHYTAIHFVGDAVLLGYCAGDSKIGALNRLRIRRVTLDELRAH